jgi:hypothetical protein
MLQTSESENCLFIEDPISNNSKKTNSSNSSNKSKEWIKKIKEIEEVKLTDNMISPDSFVKHTVNNPKSSRGFYIMKFKFSKKVNGVQRHHYLGVVDMAGNEDPYSIQNMMLPTFPIAEMKSLLGFTHRIVCQNDKPDKTSQERIRQEHKDICKFTNLQPLTQLLLLDNIYGALINKISTELHRSFEKPFEPQSQDDDWKSVINNYASKSNSQIIKALNITKFDKKSGDVLLQLNIDQNLINYALKKILNSQKIVLSNTQFIFKVEHFSTVQDDKLKSIRGMVMNSDYMKNKLQNDLAEFFFKQAYLNSITDDIPTGSHINTIITILKEGFFINQVNGELLDYFKRKKQGQLPQNVRKLDSNAVQYRFQEQFHHTKYNKFAPLSPEEQNDTLLYHTSLIPTLIQLFGHDAKDIMFACVSDAQTENKIKGAIDTLYNVQDIKST